MPRAPYSFTLRNTLYPEGLGLKAATPWWVMSASQYDSSPGAATISVSAASSVKEFKAGLPLSASDNCALMTVKSSQEAVTKKPCMLYTTIARPKDLENSCHTARAVRHFYIHQTPSHNKHPRHSGKRNSCSCSHILQPVQPQMATVTVTKHQGPIEIKSTLRICMKSTWRRGIPRHLAAVRYIPFQGHPGLLTS